MPYVNFIGEVKRRYGFKDGWNTFIALLYFGWVNATGAYGKLAHTFDEDESFKILVEDHYPVLYKEFSPRVTLGKEAHELYARNATWNSDAVQFTEELEEKGHTIIAVVGYSPATFNAVFNSPTTQLSPLIFSKVFTSRFVPRRHPGGDFIKNPNPVFLEELNREIKSTLTKDPLFIMLADKEAKVKACPSTLSNCIGILVERDNQGAWDVTKLREELEEVLRVTKTTH